MSRLVWYVGFSLVVAYVLSAVGLPSLVVAGYLVIAAVGFVMVLRDMRTTATASRADFARSVMKARNQNLARATAARQAVEKFPWYPEVDAAQAASLSRGANPGGLFTSFNPYWSLSFEALMRHGLASQLSINLMTDMARNNPPDDWMNGFMLSDLAAAGYSEEESLIRIGLFKAFEAMDE